MTTDGKFMSRCLQLAEAAAGKVAPNPMVGAILVHEGKIIGEGYHQQYGEAHAEVNCINDVLAENQHLVSLSTLYVSLEPCAHFGKTPPCTDLIIEHKIPKVVIGCSDPFSEVNGKGIEKLQEAGVTVIQNVLEKECKELNKRFFTFHKQNRPYIILKWAQTINRKIGHLQNHDPNKKDHKPERLRISNEFTNRLVHKWRSEEASILIGTNTAVLDNPQLTNRLWHGKSPVRLIIDMNLRIPAIHHIFFGPEQTIIFNRKKEAIDKPTLRFYKLSADSAILPQITDECYRVNIQSILVEGGSLLLQSFINDGLWDEARIITNETTEIENGIMAPELKEFDFCNTKKIMNDRIQNYRHTTI